jgi:hypothetical protein
MKRRQADGILKIKERITKWSSSTPFLFDTLKTILHSEKDCTRLLSQRDYSSVSWVGISCSGSTPTSCYKNLDSGEVNSKSKIFSKFFLKVKSKTENSPEILTGSVVRQYFFSFKPDNLVDLNFLTEKSSQITSKYNLSKSEVVLTQILAKAFKSFFNRLKILLLGAARLRE